MTNPTVELRRRPDHRSECVTEVVMGSVLKVLDQDREGRWLRVLAPDGYRAWVRSWGTGRPAGGWPRSGVFVSVAFAAVRGGPSLRAPAVAPVTMGCRLDLRRGRSHGWRSVGTPDGRVGWIAAGAIVPDRRAAAGRFWSPPQRGRPSPRAGDFARASLRTILVRAGSLIGVPYRWGGASPLGIDCSGFVRLCLGLEGIPLPRDARHQAGALRGWSIGTDPARLRAGDLVFFEGSPGRIDHVGIGAGGGPGRFLHASGRVRLSSLSSKNRLYEPSLCRKVCLVVRPPWPAEPG